VVCSASRLTERNTCSRLRRAGTSAPGVFDSAVQALAARRERVGRVHDRQIPGGIVFGFRFGLWLRWWSRRRLFVQLLHDHPVLSCRISGTHLRATLLRAPRLLDAKRRTVMTNLIFNASVWHGGYRLKRVRNRWRASVATRRAGCCVRFGLAAPATALPTKPATRACNGWGTAGDGCADAAAGGGTDGPEGFESPAASPSPTRLSRMLREGINTSSTRVIDRLERTDYNSKQ
jgi:hypothetical protein